MRTLFLAAGAAALALTAGSAFAAKRATHSAMVTPPQPIPYAQLDAYLKASPKQRASNDWWAGANTGATADTAATAPTAPSESAPSTQPSNPATPPVDNPAPSSTNPNAAPNSPNAPDATNQPGVTPPDGSSTPR